MEPTVVHAPAESHADLLTPLLLALLVAGTAIFLWFAASEAEIDMAVHVTAAVVWVGGGTILTVLAILTQRSRDAHALAILVRQTELIGTRIFTPAALVTLAFGVALVEKDGVGYRSFWIDFALAVWALSFVLGAALIGPPQAPPVDQRSRRRRPPCAARNRAGTAARAD